MKHRNKNSFNDVAIVKNSITTIVPTSSSLNSLNKVRTDYKVSIIVPIYNIELYVRRCIDSLLKQSMKDIEIILIDDGSVDRCGEICDEYAALDRRVRVIHQNNKGLSDARNAGLDIATGKYIMFVDGDDWVEQGLCQIPYEIAKQYDADVVIFRYVYDNSIKPKDKNNEFPTHFSKNQAVQYIFQNHGAMVWNKLYRRSLLENIRFRTGRYYEDGPFITDVILKMENVFFINEVLYHACYRKDSITHSAGRKISNDYFEMSSLMAKQLEEMGYLEEAEWSRIEYTWIYLLRYGRYAKYGQESIRYLLKLRKPPESFGYRKKLMYGVLRISPRLFDIISLLFGKRMKMID